MHEREDEDREVLVSAQEGSAKCASDLHLILTSGNALRVRSGSDEVFFPFFFFVFF